MNTLDVNISGNSLKLHLPIQKVDVEKRQVSGFATLDNIDKHGDIVDADASQKAFDRFRGNIREMHLPKAVGRMVSFETKQVNENGQEYTGIYVTAKVSKGAQDTWEKVLDGTLNGFSIGGLVKERGEKSLDSGETVRVIKDYDLMELSLVDSPANPLANVLSIEKLEDGTFKVDGIATIEDEPEEVLEVEKSGAITTRLLNIIEKLIGQGGNTMDKVEKAEAPAEEIVEETVETEVVEKAEDAIDTPDEEVVEKAADVSEVEDTPDEAPALDVNSLIDAVVEKVTAILKAEAESEEVVEEEVAEKAADSDSETEVLTELKSLISNVAENVENLSTRISSLEDSTAVKKSGDVDIADDEPVKKESFWGNSMVPGFLGVNDL